MNTVISSKKSYGVESTCSIEEAVESSTVFFSKSTSYANKHTLTVSIYRFEITNPWYEFEVLVYKNDSKTPSIVGYPLTYTDLNNTIKEFLRKELKL